MSVDRTAQLKVCLPKMIALADETPAADPPSRARLLYGLVVLTSKCCAG